MLLDKAATLGCKSMLLQQVATIDPKIRLLD